MIYEFGSAVTIFFQNEIEFSSTWKLKSSAITCSWSKARGPKDILVNSMSKLNRMSVYYGLQTFFFR